MFLNLGQNVLVAEEDIIGIFELDNTTWAFRTREFLGRAEKEGRVAALGDDLPRSFVLCREGGKARVYLTTLTTAALGARASASLTSTDHAAAAERERQRIQVSEPKPNRRRKASSL